MKKTMIAVLLIIAVVVMVQKNGSIAAQDKYDLKAPNGISFSEIREYEDLQVFAPSQRKDNNELRIILGNTTMIKAYKEGIPGNGKPFPEGSVVVKIGWSEKKSSDFPAAIEPDELKRVEFIMKDSKRFPDTSGWGYARFLYDTKTSTFTPYGKDSSFAQEFYQCHTTEKGKISYLPIIRAGKCMMGEEMIRGEALLEHGGIIILSNGEERHESDRNRGGCRCRNERGQHHKAGPAW
jgi:hypothetical protein